MKQKIFATARLSCLLRYLSHVDPSWTQLDLEFWNYASALSACFVHIALSNFNSSTPISQPRPSTPGYIHSRHVELSRTPWKHLLIEWHFGSIQFPHISRPSFYVSRCNPSPATYISFDFNSVIASCCWVSSLLHLLHDEAVLVYIHSGLNLFAFILRNWIDLYDIIVVICLCSICRPSPSRSVSAGRQTLQRLLYWPVTHPIHLPSSTYKLKSPKFCCIITFILQLSN